MMGPSQPPSLARFLQMQGPGTIAGSDKYVVGKAAHFPSLMKDLLGSDASPNRQAPVKTRKDSANKQLDLPTLAPVTSLAVPPDPQSKQWQIPGADPESEERKSPLLAPANNIEDPETGRENLSPQMRVCSQPDSVAPGPEISSSTAQGSAATQLAVAIAPGEVGNAPAEPGSEPAVAAAQTADPGREAAEATMIRQESAGGKPATAVVKRQNLPAHPSPQPIPTPNSKSVKPAEIVPVEDRGPIGPPGRKPATASVVEMADPAAAPSSRVDPPEPQTAAPENPQTPPSDWPAAAIPDLAFAARLMAIPPQSESGRPKEPTPNAPAAATPRSIAPELESQALSSIRETARAVPSDDSSRNRSSADTAEPKSDLTERPRKITLAQSTAGESPSAAKVPTQTFAEPPTPAVRTGSQPPSSPAAKPQTLYESDPLSAAAPPKPPVVAHDIRLEVQGEDQRVQVRLVERGGEVHVAVRTPDAHLAETLREDLPGLSSRLTESGFHTETWHPGTSAGTEWHRHAEPSGNTSPDSDSQPRQNGRDSQQENQQPGRPKIPREEVDRKEKGEDFEWFMSTTR